MSKKIEKVTPEPEKGELIRVEDVTIKWNLLATFLFCELVTPVLNEFLEEFFSKKGRVNDDKS